MSPAADILVVEDDPAIVDFVQRVLRRAGYAVRTAGDGAVALAAIAEHRPALVLLDLTLPGVRGEAVVEQLRRQPSAHLAVPRSPPEDGCTVPLPHQGRHSQQAVPPEQICLLPLHGDVTAIVFLPYLQHRPTDPKKARRTT